MALFSTKRTITADLKELTLLDLVHKLEQEYGPKGLGQGFYTFEVVNEHHIIFKVPRGRESAGVQLHEFSYDKNRQVISVKSKYTFFFSKFMGLYFYAILILIIKWSTLTSNILVFIVVLFLGATVLTGIDFFSNLSDRAKFIERELITRTNYLLKQKGYIPKI